LNLAYDQQEAERMQSLSRRGLLGSTLLGRESDAVERQRQSALNRLNDNLQNRDAALSLDALRAQAGLSRESLQADAALSGDLLGFMERREDTYPDNAFLAQIAAQYGAAGGQGNPFSQVAGAGTQTPGDASLYNDPYGVSGARPGSSIYGSATGYGGAPGVPSVYAGMAGGIGNALNQGVYSGPQNYASPGAPPVGSNVNPGAGQISPTGQVGIGRDPRLQQAASTTTGGSNVQRLYGQGGQLSGGNRPWMQNDQGQTVDPTGRIIPAGTPGAGYTGAGGWDPQMARQQAQGRAFQNSPYQNQPSYISRGSGYVNQNIQLPAGVSNQNMGTAFSGYQNPRDAGAQAGIVPYDYSMGGYGYGQTDMWGRQVRSTDQYGRPIRRQGGRQQQASGYSGGSTANANRFVAQLKSTNPTTVANAKRALGSMGYTAEAIAQIQADAAAGRDRVRNTNEYDRRIRLEEHGAPGTISPTGEVGIGRDPRSPWLGDPRGRMSSPVGPNVVGGELGYGWMRGGGGMAPVPPAGGPTINQPYAGSSPQFSRGGGGQQWPVTATPPGYNQFQTPPGAQSGMAGTSRQDQEAMQYYSQMGLPPQQYIYLRSLGLRSADIAQLMQQGG
jgi:hypothetical protein